MELLNSINVKYEYTDNMYLANKWLNELPDIFSADFEVASKYTIQDKKLIEYRLANNNLTKQETIKLKQQLNANGLSHPSLTAVTHLSIGVNEDKSYVIICSNDSIRKLIFNFLTNTDKLQIWHNIGFDGYHIYYHTHKFPKNFVDTRLLSKCILNDANPVKDRVGLKELMAYAYGGSWAIAKDNFTIENLYDADMIKYTAIDGAATYKLYQDILADLNSFKI